MQSTIPSAISNFETDNAGLKAPTEALLEKIVTTRPIHARFLNTLALMEHIGSYKIMATQSGAEIDQPTMKHLAEEARHAFFFKRQAEKAGGKELAFEPDELFAPAQARMYFQRLEVALRRAFGAHVHPRTIYLYMSMIIEFRAVWGYSLYQSVLQRAGNSLSLKSLLAEEEGHLSDMAERLGEIGDWSSERVANFCAVEKKLYERLLSGLEEAVEAQALKGAA